MDDAFQLVGHGVPCPDISSSNMEQRNPIGQQGKTRIPREILTREKPIGSTMSDELAKVSIIRAHGSVESHPFLEVRAHRLAGEKRSGQVVSTSAANATTLSWILTFPSGW
jgi:hypothetical protein